MGRYRPNKGRSIKKFNRGSKKHHGKNVRAPMRGGYRL